MIIGVGMDLVEVERIRKASEKFGMRFFRRILGESELAAMPDNFILWLSGRFAAKEAAMKALGTGYAQGVAFKDIEILTSPSRQPRLALLGKASMRAAELGARATFVSISHEHSMACAVVILEG